MVSKKNVRQLLQDAASSLFVANGYEVTTTADIAREAGVTERTLFRYFPDKRELLFDDEVCGHDVLLNAVNDAPATLGAIETLFHAFRAVEGLVVARRQPMQSRFRIVSSASALQERESTKLLALADGLGERLRARGVPALEASLASRVGIAAFRIAMEAWLADQTCDYQKMLGATQTGLGNLVRSA